MVYKPDEESQEPLQSDEVIYHLTPSKLIKEKHLPLEDKSRFKMTGVCKEVHEILETTGFDQFLL